LMSLDDHRLSVVIAVYFHPNSGEDGENCEFSIHASGRLLARHTCFQRGERRLATITWDFGREVPLTFTVTHGGKAARPTEKKSMLHELLANVMEEKKTLSIKTEKKGKF